MQVPVAPAGDGTQAAKLVCYRFSCVFDAVDTLSCNQLSTPAFDLAASYSARSPHAPNGW